ncbi:LysR family transcriptional regulator, partial [Xanthomonas perforans]
MIVEVEAQVDRIQEMTLFAALAEH